MLAPPSPRLSLLVALLARLVRGNLRCYSCAPCGQLDWGGWRDPATWQQDCPLDRQDSHSGSAGNISNESPTLQMWNISQKYLKKYFG